MEGSRRLSSTGPLIVAVLLASALALYLQTDFRNGGPYRTVEGISLIAHAGGGLPVGVYTNSRQAFDNAYRNGFRVIEADLSWTSDGELVVLHDWGKVYSEWFWSRWWLPPFLAGKFARPATKAEFMSARMRAGLSQMDFPALLEWMRSHPDTRIVADAKSDNVRALTKIAELEPGLQQAFIAQINAPDELEPVRRLGFRDVLFVLDGSSLSPAEVADFLARVDLLGATVPVDRVRELAPTLAHLAPLFVHTVNDPELAGALRDLGVEGVYTDFLVPANSPRA